MARKVTSGEIKRLHGWQKTDFELLKRQKKAHKKTTSNLRKVKKK